MNEVHSSLLNFQFKINILEGIQEISLEKLLWKLVWKVL
jgi:hypothetical protein